jgi:hypothetical protein
MNGKPTRDDALATAAGRLLADTGGTDMSDLRAAIADTFRRRSRFLTVVTWVKMGAFVIGAMVAAYLFFTTSDPRMQLACAAAFVTLALGNGMLFILYWMEVHRAWTARELKRLEVQVALLGGKQGSGEEGDGGCISCL